MRIGGSEGTSKRGSPLDSGRDDDTKSIQSKVQQEWVEVHQGEGVL